VRTIAADMPIGTDRVTTPNAINKLVRNPTCKSLSTAKPASLWPS